VYQEGVLKRERENRPDEDLVRAESRVQEVTRALHVPFATPAFESGIWNGIKKTSGKIKARAVGLVQPFAPGRTAAALFAQDLKVMNHVLQNIDIPTANKNALSKH